MEKLATNVDEQIAKLESRGMSIGDKDKAKECLLDIGYFRLGFYWFPFEKSYPRKINRTHEFKEGTFFGIHYREENYPMAKFVTVIKGRGLDYIVDLRKESPTYLQWEAVELSEDNALAVLIPAGFGHAFISLQNDTIQFFSTDRSGNDAHSKQINYKEPQIGLKLPIPITKISDYDLNAPFVSEGSAEQLIND